MARHDMTQDDIAALYGVTPADLSDPMTSIRRPVPKQPKADRKDPKNGRA